MDGVVCVCGMGKSVSLFDGKIFLIPASNRQDGLLVSRFAIVPYWRVLQQLQQQQTDSAF